MRGELQDARVAMERELARKVAAEADNEVRSRVATVLTIERREMEAQLAAGLAVKRKELEAEMAQVLNDSAAQLQAERERLLAEQETMLSEKQDLVARERRRSDVEVERATERVETRLQEEFARGMMHVQTQNAQNISRLQQEHQEELRACAEEHETRLAEACSNAQMAVQQVQRRAGEDAQARVEEVKRLMEAQQQQYVTKMKEEVAKATETACKEASQRVWVAEERAEEAERRARAAEQAREEAASMQYQVEAKLRTAARMRAEEVQQYVVELEDQRGETQSARDAVHETLAAADQRVDAARRERDAALTGASVVERQLMMAMKEIEGLRGDLVEAQAQERAKPTAEGSESGVVEVEDVGGAAKEDMIRAAWDAAADADSKREAAEAAQAEAEEAARKAQLEVEALKAQLLDSRRADLQELHEAQAALVEAKSKGRSEREKLRSQLKGAEKELKRMCTLSPLSPMRFNCQMSELRLGDVIKEIESAETPALLMSLQQAVAQTARTAIIEGVDDVINMACKSLMTPKSSRNKENQAIQA